MLSSIGPLELAIVAIVALLVFGPKRLPEAGRGLGRSMREFKAGISGDSEKPAAKSDAEAD
ncbi:MAG: twin-arginine translocase TatA/TatE family subunit [Actinobacteria bacterium]|nr:twin-arginine translocase TatA/TatE family subunit [Actinomycetota bacterium]